MDDVAAGALEHPGERSPTNITPIAQIDHEVKPAPSVGKVANDLLELPEAVRQNPHRNGFAPRGDDLGGESCRDLEVVVTALPERNAGTSAREFERNGAPDAACGSGDDATSASKNTPES